MILRFKISSDVFSEQDYRSRVMLFASLVLQLAETADSFQIIDSVLHFRCIMSALETDDRAKKFAKSSTKGNRDAYTINIAFGLWIGTKQTEGIQ